MYKIKVRGWNSGSLKSIQLRLAPSGKSAALRSPRSLRVTHRLRQTGHQTLRLQGLFTKPPRRARPRRQARPGARTVHVRGAQGRRLRGRGRRWSAGRLRHTLGLPRGRAGPVQEGGGHPRAQRPARGGAAPARSLRGARRALGRGRACATTSFPSALKSGRLPWKRKAAPSREGPALGRAQSSQRPPPGTAPQEPPSRGGWADGSPAPGALAGMSQPGGARKCTCT